MSHFNFLTVTLVFSSLCATPATALAQADAHTTAIGVSVGAALPSDASLSNGPEIVGNIENYLTPRVSVRGQVAWSTWSITGRGFAGSVRPLVFDGNVVYNWDRGAWHPYATAGAGVYHYAFDIDGLTGDQHDNQFGIDIGGGVEGFVTRDTAFTGELLFHAVDSPATSAVSTFETRFWSLRVGLKHYF
jgi:hypothetical protein